MAHSPLIYCNTALGYIFNITLAYLTQTAATKKIGNYRYLLLTLCMFDMVYATAQLLIIPIPFIFGYSWSFVQTGIFIKNPAIFQFCTILYCSLFNQSLVLLTYHFIYRYVAICKSHLLPYFSRPSVLALVVFMYLGSATVWGLICYFTLYGPPSDYIGKNFLDTFGYPVQRTELVGGAYFIPDPDGTLHWHSVQWTPVAGVLMLCCILYTLFGVVIYCAYKTKETLNKGMISSKAHQLQVQLYKALLIQLCVPLVFEYTPCVSIYLSATLALQPNCDWTVVFFSAYPFLEPLVVIYFVRDYRTALFKILRLDKCHSATVSAVQSLSQKSLTTGTSISVGHAPSQEQLQEAAQS